MSIPNGIETIDFSESVASDDIRTAALRHIEGAKTRARLVRRKERFRVGRLGSHLSRHLVVIPSEGNKWFVEGQSYASIQVVKYEWPAQAKSNMRYHEALHCYEVRWFAEKLASTLGGAVRPRFWGKWPRTIPCCSGPDCREPAVFNPAYGKDACPRHGTAYELVGQLLPEPCS